jgi:hypothetical protein
MWHELGLRDTKSGLGAEVLNMDDVHGQKTSSPAAGYGHRILEQQVHTFVSESRVNGGSWLWTAWNSLKQKEKISSPY